MKQTVHIGHRAIARRIVAIYFLTATAWIAGSDLAMLLWMPETAPAVLGSIAKGMAFVLVTSIALYAVLRRVAAMESQPAPAVNLPVQAGKAGWRALAPFLALALALIGASTIMFLHNARQHRENARDELALSADLKSYTLGAWLKQRKESALTYRRARFFQDDLRPLLDGDRAVRARLESRLDEIRKSLELDAILVLDSGGKTRVAVGAQRDVSADLARDAAQAARTRIPRLHVLHRVGDTSDTPLVLDQIVPIELDSDLATAPAVFVMRDDPATTILSVMRYRPAPSKTAETVLVRRAGGRIEHLSSQLGKPVAAHMPGTADAGQQLASEKLFSGASFVEGAPDYRGIPVLATSRPVPGTDWRVIAKVDVDEVLEPVWQDAWIHLALIIGLTLLAAIGANRLWRQQAQLAVLRERALTAERDLVGKHLDLLSRHANDIILLLDPQGRIAEANERAVERYRYPRESLIGMPSAQLRLPTERAASTQRFESILSGSGEIYETRHVTADGEVFPVEVSARPVPSGGATWIQTINRDLTARKRDEARIERLNRLRDALSATNRAIVRKKGEEGLFEKICEIVVQRAGFLFAWVGVAGPELSAMLPVANVGTPQEYLEAVRGVLAERKMEAFGIVRAALREGRPVVCQDFVNDPRMAPWHDQARKWGIGSMAAVPILKDGKPFASLNVYSGEPNTFDDDYVSLLEEMAGDVSYALGVMQRDRELAIARERLELAMLGAGFGIWDWWDVNDPAHVWWSTRAGELAGLAAAVGAYNVGKFTTNIHPEDLQRVETALRAALRNQAPFDVEYRVRSEDGASRWIHSKGHRVLDASGKVTRMLGVVEDIDVRKRAEDGLHESEQRFRAVLEQSIAAVYVVQDGKLVYVNPRMREIFGYSIDEVINPDLMAHLAPQERVRVAEQMARRLRSEPEAAYSLAALRKDGTSFTLGVHAKLATYDGRPAIIAVAQDITEKARAEEEIKRYVARLEQAMHSTINVVATIGELRDPYTHGHEGRVGEIAAAIAGEMGLDASRIEGVRIAGYLHDVGKIAVPAEILSKPSRLSKVEFDLVKQHAQTSYDILKGVEFPWPVAEAAWQHHERLDGSGYPRGLKGDEIILEARVLAVADTVEAMSSHRPYRPGLGIEAALAEIESSRGRLFDAQVVDACLQLFRKKGYRLPA